MRCLGIDIGSSSIKGAVLDCDSGGLSHLVREPFPDAVSGLPSGFHEVAPGAIVEATRRVIEQLVHAAPEATRAAWSSQMGGILLVDQAGRPLTNYLSWRDQRSTTVSNGSRSLDVLRRQWSDQQFLELGSELKPGSATVLLHWLAQHDQLPESAIPVTVGDFVISTLCQAVPQMHRSQAIGMLNLTTGDWHTGAFAAGGFDQLQWPALASDVTVIGEATVGSRRLSCYPAIGDQQAALLGIGLQPHELSINCSTGSQVSQITDEFRPGDCQTRCWFGGKFLNTITHIPAGRSLTVLEALLTELPRAAGVNVDESWKLIAQAAERSSANGLRCDLSFFASAMGCDGRIEGITTENLTVGGLFDAALEFMADSYALCARRLSAVPSWSQIAISGGLVQSFPSLRRKLQTRFTQPFREIAEQEETLLGLLNLARLAST